MEGRGQVRSQVSCLEVINIGIHVEGDLGEGIGILF